MRNYNYRSNKNKDRKNGRKVSNIEFATQLLIVSLLIMIGATSPVQMKSALETPNSLDDGLARTIMTEEELKEIQEDLDNHLGDIGETPSADSDNGCTYKNASSTEYDMSEANGIQLEFMHGKYPYLNQAKPPIGQHKVDYQTMRNVGCGQTSSAMIISYFNKKLKDPRSLSDEMVQMGLSGPQGSYGTRMYKIFKKYGLETQDLGTDKEAIKKALKEGKMILFLARGGSVFTRSGHFLVLVELTPDEKQVKILDPGVIKRNYRDYDLDYVIRNTQGNKSDMLAVWKINDNMSCTESDKKQNSKSDIQDMSIGEQSQGSFSDNEYKALFGKIDSIFKNAGISNYSISTSSGIPNKRNISINEGKTYYAASTIKLFVGSALYYYKLNNPKTVRDMNIMINRSDNDAWTRLAGSKDKGPGVIPENKMRSYVDKYGSHLKYYQVTRDQASGKINEMDSRTLNKMLVSITNRNASGADDILDAMCHQVHRSKIPAGIPSTQKVCNKTGEYDGFIIKSSAMDYQHDSAIIQTPKGTYTLAILTSTTPGISLDTRHKAIATVAREINTYMNN